MDDLPDAILISILSRLRIKEAARTSVLSRRWRPLWTLTGSSDFYDPVPRGPGPMNTMPAEKFKALIDRVLELHQAPQLDKFILWDRSKEGLSSGYFDELICRAMKKEPKELNLSTFGLPDREREFPHLYKLLTHTRSSAAFGCLKSLDMRGLQVNDETVHCLLAACRNLESLTLCYSCYTKNLHIVDPLPKLKILCIACCPRIQSLEISVASLVSFEYSGRDIDLQFKNVANLSVVRLNGTFCECFVFEANKHLHYSSKLEKLQLFLPSELHGRHNYIPALPHYYSLKQLEVTAASVVGRSLLFFTILLKACPTLNEFIIKLMYNMGEVNPPKIKLPILIPKVEASEASIFHLESLKVVELHGYIGCLSQEELLMWLLKIAPSLDKVVIDCINNYTRKVKKRKFMKDFPKCEFLTYTYAKSFHEARKLAEQLRFKIPLQTELVIM